MSAISLAAERKTNLHDRVLAVPELGQICDAWERQHGKDARQLAWLAIEMGELLTERLKQGGNGEQLKALMNLQIDCIRAFSVERGLSLDAVNSASAGLVQAIETTAYLARLPD
jgi:hypothetical protein